MLPTFAEEGLMVVTKERLVVLCTLVSLFAPWLEAADPYEATNPASTVGDDEASTSSVLSHGMVQLHDLEQVGGVEDLDWISVPTIGRHSYEVRVSGNLAWDQGACGTCAQVERVNAAGTVLTEDVGTINEGNGGPIESKERSIRWIAPSTNSLDSYIRVRGSLIFSETENSIYQIRGYDTTYGVPRWNNANGQITVFLVTNMVDAEVTGDIHFYNTAGTLLATQSFTVPKYGMYVLSTGTIGALAGLSGHAQVAHTAGYGGLTGKAVALEPATGFSFDTPFVPIPQ
jgi:hypothetical protein